MRRRWLFRVGGLIFAALASAALGEALLRWTLGPPGRLLFSLSRSFHDEQTDWNLVYGMTSEGARVTCPPKSVDAKGSRVVVMGDSFVFGQGVADCEDFVSLMSSSFPAYRFMNYGIIGAGMQDYVQVAEDFVQNGDRTIVVFYGNDVGRFKSNQGPLERMSRYSTLAALIQRSYRAVIVRRAMKMWRERRRPGENDVGKISLLGGKPNNVLSTLRGNPDYYRTVVEPDPDRAAQFLSYFDRLAVILENRVGRENVIVTFVPEGHTVSMRLRDFLIENGGTVAPFGEPGSAYELVRSRAKMRGFSFVDVFPGLLADGDGLYHPHDLHWSPAGHRRMADLLSSSPELEALLRRTDSATPFEKSAR